jgi:hypothetical protein
MYYDAILNKDTLEVIKNATRDECLEWLHTYPDNIDHVLVGQHDLSVLITGREYVNSNV